MNEMLYGRFPTLSSPVISKQVSRLVQGTAFINASNIADVPALFDAVFEMGCTAFDTAQSYSGGNSEQDDCTQI